MDNTNTYLLIASGALLLISAVLIFYYFRTKALLDEMWAVKTYDAVELKRMCIDGFDAIVEVQGAVSCDKPLTSFAAQVPCCWFHIKVRHEDGRPSTLLEVANDYRSVSQDTKWVTDMDRCYSTVFKVEDKTGYTLVYPEGADLETTTIFNGTVARDEPWFEKLLTGHADTYRVTEEAFMPTGYAYVLGQASPAGDDVMIRHPDHGYIDPHKSFFVISRKTERELSNYRQITVRACLWFGVAALLASVFFLLEGLGIVHVL